MVKCSICSNKSKLVWRDSKYKLYKCKNCETAFLYPLPPHPEKIYDKNYFHKWYINYYLERKRYLIKLLSKIENYVKLKGKLLDVGCGIGILLEVAEEKGCEVYGQEVSSFAASYSQEKGFTVNQISLSEARLPENYFDIITIFDVLAHLEDPLSYLKSCKKLLKPGGVIIIKTPYYSRFTLFFTNLLSFTGKSKSLLHIPAQMFHFYTDSFKIISESLELLFFNSFKVKEFQTLTKLNLKGVIPFLYKFLFSNKSLIVILKKDIL
ncbi:class I SAM-dependent methyltransferase [bacterium]|nr:class I SAM-dependent methyltransferase [bacterium]